MNKIVIDLDNTVAIYDDLLLEICDEFGLNIPKECNTKLQISNHLKSTNRNNIWTEIQGICYGRKYCF